MTPELEQMHGRRRSALLRLARRAASESDPRAVMRELLVEAQRLHGATGGFVGRWDNERQVLVDFVNTLPTGRAPRVVALGVGAAGRAALQRAPVVINDYQRMAAAGPPNLRSDVQAALAAPMLHEGRLLGVVVIVSNRPGKRFTPGDADMVLTLGSIAASSLVELESKRTAERLRLQTERLQQFIEATSDAIIVMDCDMRLIGWNRGAEQLYGWRPEEVLGQMPPIIPPELCDRAHELWSRVRVDGETVANCEELRLTRDGQRLPTIATISPVRDETGAIVGVIGIAKDLSAMKVVEEHRRMLSRLEEREAIAMDLHDNTMQVLHGAVLLLSAVERQTEADFEQVRRGVRQVRDQLNDAVHELKTYLRDLRTSGGAQRGLCDGLIALSEKVRANVIVGIDLDVDAALAAEVPSEHVEHLLAIASEATYNAIRHARVGALAVRLRREEDRVVMTIADDGPGFDTEAASSSGGHGLANMAERARQIGARLTLFSRPGTGTQVRVELASVAAKTG